MSEYFPLLENFSKKKFNLPKPKFQNSAAAADLDYLDLNQAMNFGLNLRKLFGQLLGLDLIPKEFSMIYQYKFVQKLGYFNFSNHICIAIIALVWKIQIMEAYKNTFPTGAISDAEGKKQFMISLDQMPSIRLINSTLIQRTAKTFAVVSLLDQPQLTQVVASEANRLGLTFSESTVAGIVLLAGSEMNSIPPELDTSHWVKGEPDTNTSKYIQSITFCKRFITRSCGIFQTALWDEGLVSISKLTDVCNADMLALCHVCNQVLVTDSESKISVDSLRGWLNQYFTGPLLIKSSVSAYLNRIVNTDRSKGELRLFEDVAPGRGINLHIEECEHMPNKEIRSTAFERHFNSDSNLQINRYCSKEGIVPYLQADGDDWLKAKLMLSKPNSIPGQSLGEISQRLSTWLEGELDQKNQENQEVNLLPGPDGTLPKPKRERPRLPKGMTRPPKKSVNVDPAE